MTIANVHEAEEVKKEGANTLKLYINKYTLTPSSDSVCIPFSMYSLSISIPFDDQQRGFMDVTKGGSPTEVPKGGTFDITQGDSSFDDPQGGSMDVMKGGSPIKVLQGGTFNVMQGDSSFNDPQGGSMDVTKSGSPIEVPQRGTFNVTLGDSSFNDPQGGSMDVT